MLDGAKFGVEYNSRKKRGEGVELNGHTHYQKDFFPWPQYST
jgi:hypothetical protein